MNYTEIESKVREATNDDPWGPTGMWKLLYNVESVEPMLKFIIRIPR